MEELVLIPTQFKSKIPHALSYPIGAEAISSALKDVPQFAELNLEFWFWRLLPPGRTNPYTVMAVNYSRTGRSLHSSKKDDLAYKQLQPRWTITVRPVHRHRRHLIKTKLEQEALPYARRWLIETGVLDVVGGLTLSFGFDEEKEMLVHTIESSLSPKLAK
jgi:hypothetical protein